MKSEYEIHRELFKVRATMSELAVSGKPVPLLLTGAEQALGWTLDRLRAPSEAEELVRLQHAQRKGIRLR